MKKWLFFGGGFLTGVILTFAVLAIIGLSNKNYETLLGANYFEQPSREIHESSFKVLQVIQDHAALVKGKDDPSSNYYFGPVYLIVNNSNRYYYDEEIIDVPRNCKVVQIGIYKYESTSGIEKTVPIVGIIER